MQNEVSTQKISISDQLTLVKDGNWNFHHIPFAAFIGEAFEDSETVETAAEVHGLQINFLPVGDYGITRWLPAFKILRPTSKLRREIPSRIGNRAARPGKALF